MPEPAKIAFDVASGLLQGRRDVQEDALASDFNVGSGVGYVVLADGMGGHEAGDVASKIVVTEVFNDLKLQSSKFETPGFDISGLLTNAARDANECLRLHSATNPETAGMGATLIATFLLQDRLFWVSIGDSPLYVFRDAGLRQINEDHSLAPQIDYMAQSGVISESAARDHPDRNCLLSVLNGEDIPQIDCPQEPFVLQAGDVVIAASDGLQFLSNGHIEQAIEKHHKCTSAEVVQYLMDEIEDLDDPHQDNVSISVIRVLDPANEQNGHGDSDKRSGSQSPDWANSAVAANSPLRPLIAGVKRMFAAFADTVTKNALR